MITMLNRNKLEPQRSLAQQAPQTCRLAFNSVYCAFHRAQWIKTSSKFKQKLVIPGGNILFKYSIFQMKNHFKMIACAFSFSTQEAEGSDSVSWRPAMAI